MARNDCGWEPRDLKSLVEEHWTTTDLATFEREHELVGHLVELNTSAGEVVVEPGCYMGYHPDRFA